MAQDLASLRLTANKFVIPLMWLHVPVIFGLALWAGSDSLWTTLGAVVLVAAPTLYWLKDPLALGTRLTTAVSYIGLIALILSTLHGHESQLDMHMYFFAALAILSAYCDWRVIVMAAVATACHHLILNFVFPAALYPGGEDFLRVVLHAAIVVLESAVLIWITYKHMLLFASNEESTRVAEEARAREVLLEKEQSDLRVKSEQERKAAMIRLADSFEKSVKGVVEIVSAAAHEMQSTAKDLAAMAEKTSQQSTAVSTASEETSLSVQTVAASAEELTSSISEIGSQVNKAANVTTQAAQGGQTASATMQALANSAQKIDEVVHLIQGIAGQTNLLALNATIEAARAGEAGRGFAVVASEVKALANQTAHATEDIQKQVSTIQIETKSAVTAIADICRTLGDVKNVSSSIAAAIEEQSAATQEIARNVLQAAEGTTRITQNVTEVTKATQGTKNVAEQMLESSSELARQSELLHKEVESFLTSIRQS